MATKYSQTKRAAREADAEAAELLRKQEFKAFMEDVNGLLSKMFSLQVLAKQAGVPTSLRLLDGWVELSFGNLGDDLNTTVSTFAPEPEEFDDVQRLLQNIAEQNRQKELRRVLAARVRLTLSKDELAALKEFGL